jgi:recombination protein RecA
MIFGQGINREGELIDLGANLNLVQRSGTWYSYGKERMGQGRENARRFLQENPEISAELRHGILEQMGLLKKKEEEPVEEVAQ